ncbi:DUF4835 family protein [candidate division KSB1 bacterium]|nr:DUF4835 family protein [candidate division KSB1 bacterium]
MKNFKHLKTKPLTTTSSHFLIVLLILVWSTLLSAGQIKTKVNVIIEKLPIDKQEKMQDFHITLKEYIESVEWLEDDDSIPLEVTLQLFLTDTHSNIEDRYKCEFLISSTDVQYFDRRFKFAFQVGDVLIYNDQAVEPLTSVINFYINMILGSELDKEREYGGDLYYKKAQSFAALGKFVRTDFILGWTEREELIKNVFTEPFRKFRKMKDYYFYGLYVREEKLDETRKNIRTALDMLGGILKEKADLEEPKQFLDAHYLEIINIFKDDRYREDVFKKLIELDPKHKELYEEHVSDS